MEALLQEIIEGKKCELHLDTQIFSQDVIMKSAFAYLDQGYFFFKTGPENVFIVQCSLKEGANLDIKTLIGEFSDSLLEMHLRDHLEKENKTIREAIITRAMTLPLDTGNFVSLDTDNLVNQSSQQEQNEIDFDKDIDDILAEIENDPDLKIDEGEIDAILKEIEEEEQKIKKPTITANLDSLKKAKDQFNS